MKFHITHCNEFGRIYNVLLGFIDGKISLQMDNDKLNSDIQKGLI